MRAALSWHPCSIPTVAFASAHCQTVGLGGEPLHPCPDASGRSNGFFQSVALKLNLATRRVSSKGTRAIEILDGHYILTLTSIETKKCTLRAIPLTQPTVSGGRVAGIAGNSWRRAGLPVAAS